MRWRVDGERTRNPGRPSAGSRAPTNRAPTDRAPTGRVLVVRLDSMGDVLLTGGAIRAVAGSADGVSMLVGRGQAATARLLPGVDDVLEFDAPWVPFEPTPVEPRTVGRLVRAIRRRRFDSALIFTSFHQSPLPTALVLRLAGVPWIGAISEDYPGALLDLRHRVPADVPEAERNLSLAVAAGFLADADGARLAVQRPTVQPAGLAARSAVRRGPPGRGGTRPLPSPTRSRAFVAALTEADGRCVVTGSSSERHLTEEVAGTAGIDVAGRLDLHGLAAVLARAHVVVVGNTGPAHLAAAVGTPVVSLFAPVVPAARWAPYGVPVIALGDQHAACRDTRARICPVPGHPCLDSIPTEQVVAAVRTLARPDHGSALGSVLDPERHPARDPAGDPAVHLALDPAVDPAGRSDLDVPTGGRP